VVEPSLGVLRDPLHRPLRRRRDERLLDRVLGGREVAVPPGDGAEHLRPQLAQQMLDTPIRPTRPHPSAGCGGPITCRTSMGMTSGSPPGPGADDAFAAIS